MSGGRYRSGCSQRYAGSGSNIAASRTFLPALRSSPPSISPSSRPSRYQVRARFRDHPEAATHPHSPVRPLPDRLEQIAIDRAHGLKSLKQIIDAARSVLADGRQVFIYPEGTRRPPAPRRTTSPGSPSSTPPTRRPVCPSRSTPVFSGGVAALSGARASR